jgi:hypothetical protein
MTASDPFIPSNFRRTGLTSGTRSLCAVAFALILLAGMTLHAVHYHGLDVVAQFSQGADCPVCADANHLGSPETYRLVPVAVTFAWRMQQAERPDDCFASPPSIYRARGPPCA